MDCLRKLCRDEPQDFAPGIYFDVPRGTYDNIPALSATVLRKWLKYQAVPAEFANWLKEHWAEEPSEYLLIGKALDCLLLEPARFLDRFAVIPEDAPRKPSSAQLRAKNPGAISREQMAWWNDFSGQAVGKEILSADQNIACLRMMDALREAPAAYGVFEHCRKAVLVGELWGIPSKCEIDLWHPEIPHILDLKTAADVQPAAFLYATRRYQYLEQAIFYLLMATDIPQTQDKDSFTFLAVRNSPPWSVMCYTFAPKNDLDHQLLYSARVLDMQRGAQSLLMRLAMDDFANDPDWQLLKFPEWEIRAAGAGAFG